MKFVLFSDLHLDSAFAWMGPRDAQAARRRRQALRDTLLRILQLARDERADALLCAGDLYEHERFTPDTAAFLRQVFADAAPLPIFLSPGNHDWFGPTSLYRQVSWSENIHLFEPGRLQPYTLAEGLTLWGGAHGGPALTPGFLDAFSVDRGGVHVALFHGSEQSAVPFQEAEKQLHAPFRAEQIPQAGLHHAFVGHFHRPEDAPWHTYPGNPDPLSFGESGPRGAVLATVHADGSVTRERRTVASTTAFDLEVDVTDAASLQEIGARVSAAVQGKGGVARITLRGSLANTVDLRLADLQPFAATTEGAVFRVGKLNPAYDFVRLAAEPTVRGLFTKDVLAAPLDEERKQRVLVAGLRALDGRTDLEVA